MASPEDTTYWLRQFEDICTRRGMTEDAQRRLWEALAHVCSQQMHEKHGACSEALHPLFEYKGAETQTDPSVSG